MTSLLRLSVCAFAACLGTLAMTAVAAPADVPPPEKRRVIVEQAHSLATPITPAPLLGEVVNPFNPAAFGQPDPEELRAIAAAQAAAQAAAVQAKPSSDRELLQVISGKIMPSGTLTLGGESLLIFGQKRLRVGDRLTVAYDGRDYSLEVTAIERTTFTLRLNQDEITRPIKPGKTP